MPHVVLVCAVRAAVIEVHAAKPIEEAEHVPLHGKGSKGGGRGSSVIDAVERQKKS